jgi:hypothetical protein
MRAFLAALCLCVVATAADARPHHHGQHHHYAHHRGHYRMAAGGRSLSAPCQMARSMGGPCGCFASELIFGHSIRNLWLAANWFGFPHTTPHVGAAAVHRHHVVIVARINGDGTFIGHDSWGMTRRRIAGWVFVDPHGGRYAARRHAHA